MTPNPSGGNHLPTGASNRMESITRNQPDRYIDADPQIDLATGSAEIFSDQSSHEGGFPIVQPIEPINPVNPPVNPVNPPPSPSPEEGGDEIQEGGDQLLEGEGLENLEGLLEGGVMHPPGGGWGGGGHGGDEEVAEGGEGEGGLEEELEEVLDDLAGL